MTKKTVEAWVWVLIYGGILLGSLGYFVYRSDELVGWTLGIVGGAAALVGVLLILLRSRMGP
jgi:hypothetical protein